MDTQWPRWEVFKQDTPGKPHQAVGSVHAGDPEHALLTARNVFARRPQAVSMWVVRAEDIFSVTREEWREAGGGRQEAKDREPKSPFSVPGARNPEPGTRHAVFRKTTHKRSLTFVDYVGEVEAASPEAALTRASTQFTDVEALAWWVVPVEAIYKSESDSETIESWFAPAKEKTYKQQSYYATVGSHASRHNKRIAQEDDDEG